MAICKKCGGKIKNPKKCPHCGPQQGPRRGRAAVYSYIHARFGPLNGESKCKCFSLTTLRLRLVPLHQPQTVRGA